MFSESIKNEDINLLEKRGFEGRIEVIDSIEKIEAAADYLQQQKLIGFDTETRPQFVKGAERHIALLQLSTSDRAFLIRVGIIGLPKPIIKIFEDTNIVKIGAGILEDIRALQNLKRFKTANFVDLQTLTSEYGIKDNSLKKITAIVMGFRISKSQRLSNWDKVPYTKAQMTYAATDAWVCYEIYKKLKTSNKNTHKIID